MKVYIIWREWSMFKICVYFKKYVSFFGGFRIVNNLILGKLIIDEYKLYYCFDYF